MYKKKKHAINNAGGQGGGSWGPTGGFRRDRTPRGRPHGADPALSRLAGAMPAGGRALLALGLLALGCAAAAADFPEGSPERRRRPPAPAPGCPRDCGCTQEGVVDCGGIDLKEFPLLLPELTNHLSLQVRARLPPAPSGAPLHSTTQLRER